MCTQRGVSMKKGEMLSAMLKLAVNAHHGQFDRGGNPYILHVLKVFHYLDSDDEELQCIAIGHDVIEDTKTTFTDLRAIGMTDRVIAGVASLTKMPGQTLDEYKQAVFANRDAMCVKLCDLRHNSDIRRLKGVTKKDIDRIQKYHEFFLEIEQRLAQ